MRRNLGKPLSLDLLAKNVYISKYHFLRKYKALTGVTPVADLRKLRLEHAADLLLTTNDTLDTIAYKTGIGDQKSLSRMFRKHYDMTIGELKKIATE